jgi:Zn-finger protein
MTPVQFPEQNIVLSKPESMTDEECSSLPVHTDGKVCISCWELTDEEISELQKTKKLWLQVYSGQSQPPVLPQVEYPFIKEG